MQISVSPTTLRAHRAGIKAQKIALVPTMGALHDGHMSLVDLARQGGADYVMASIFVNPTQFAPNEDFAKYPRTMAADLQKLADAGVDEVFTPHESAIYPDGFATQVTVAGLSDGLCGRFRPGHFNGVATVVLKLFTLTRPHLAVFGEKDFQQLQIIRRLVTDLALDIEIIAAPTKRESTGLALSSRNRYLGPSESAIAPKFYAILQATAAKLGKISIAADFVAQREAILAEAGDALGAAGFGKIDYIDWVANDDLQKITEKPKPAHATRLIAALWLGKTRLIDNIAI